LQPNHARIAIQCIAIALVCIAIGGCAPSPGPEEAVRGWVRDAQAAAENRDSGVLMKMVADSYADARGNDKEDIGQMLRAWFLRNRSIMLATKIDEVTIMGDSAASVMLTAGMAGTSDGMSGLSADAYTFELELEQHGSDWKLISARWAEIGRDLR
jgi:hypothetical protein